MYHAYDKETNIFTGREGLLIEYRFTHDGWIEFIKNDNNQDAVLVENVSDDFEGNNLSNKWQWSVFQNPDYKIKGGKVYLPSVSDTAATFLGQKTLSGEYTATIKVDVKKSTAAAGLAAIGDEKNIISTYYKNGTIQIIQVKNGKETELLSQSVPKKKKMNLRMQVKNGKDIHFYYSTDGNYFVLLNQTYIDGSFLPPWDRAVRAGMVAKGGKNTFAVFDSFKLLHKAN